MEYRTIPAEPTVADQSIRDALHQLVKSDDLPSPSTVSSSLKAAWSTFSNRQHDILTEGGSAETIIRDFSKATDSLVAGLLNLARYRAYRKSNLTAGDRFAVLAVGGYGREEMAPQSDIDLLFLLPYKQTPHAEQVIEYTLYRLWDMGMKVGHSVRSIDECLKSAKADQTIRTNLLEARFVWGEMDLAESFIRQYHSAFPGHQASDFVEAKLSERDARHKRVGDSRFLLEPNVKEGKGGLRDLQTLLWIGKALYQIRDLSDLVEHELFDRVTLRKFERASTFFWTIRCHLHFMAKRPEDRLTFESQSEIARVMGFSMDRPGSLAVERFMKRYYQHVTDVGSLTRIFCSALDEQHKRRPTFSFARLGFRKRSIDGFSITHGRLNFADHGQIAAKPEEMIRLFHVSQKHELDVHPAALQTITQTLPSINDDVRGSKEVSRWFVDMISSQTDPAITLRRMADCGLLNRYLPEFARITAQMQFDLYHVYTVDEHSILAMHNLHRIEQGLDADELPLATELMPQVLSRETLYIAMLLHDIGKGRRTDHSLLGARIARQIGMRIGLPEEQIETIVWLIQYHLLLSETAFRRDLDDPKTIADTAEIIQSPERLRLLLILTVADIRAVGPDVWNGWKGQLLRDLYNGVHAVITGMPPASWIEQRAEDAISAFRQQIARVDDAQVPADLEAYIDTLDPRYWTSFDAEACVHHAQIIAGLGHGSASFHISFKIDEFRDKTEVIVISPDHPGLFSKVCGALALSGVDIAGARIFTSKAGMALDVFDVQTRNESTAVNDPARLERMRIAIEQALTGELWLDRELSRTLPNSKTKHFEVAPRVMIDNQGSATYTLVEINARDRPGLLYDISRCLVDIGVITGSAHIATYGERAVDVFYVRDLFGHKLRSESKLKRLKDGLLQAINAHTEQRAA